MVSMCLRGVVWCGVVWCAVVWCAVVWCGVLSRLADWCCQLFFIFICFSSFLLLLLLSILDVKGTSSSADGDGNGIGRYYCCCGGHYRTCVECVCALVDEESALAPTLRHAAAAIGGGVCECIIARPEATLLPLFSFGWMKGGNRAAQGVSLASLCG